MQKIGWFFLTRISLYNLAHKYHMLYMYLASIEIFWGDVTVYILSLYLYTCMHEIFPLARFSVSFKTQIIWSQIGRTCMSDVYYKGPVEFSSIFTAVYWLFFCVLSGDDVGFQNDSTQGCKRVAGRVQGTVTHSPSS